VEPESFRCAFRTLQGKLLVATVIRSGETAPDAFVVVVNGQDQRALWEAGLDLPAGWRRGSAAMSGSECLAAIDASWPDVPPASVRTGAPGAAADGDGDDRFVPQAVAEQAGRPG